MLLFFVPLALASPFRGPLEKPAQVHWEPGRSAERVIIKLHDDVVGIPYWGESAAVPVVAENHPLWAELERLSEENALPRLTQYFVLERSQGDGEVVAERLNEMTWVEQAYLAPEPLPPPSDLSPVTPDFRSDQQWLNPAPVGIDRFALGRWPGGNGSEIAVADLEYSWDKDHEDLDVPSDQLLHGVDSELYRFHGTSVLGQLFGQANGYGVEGVLSEAEPVMLSPFLTDDVYNVAQAILTAIEVLGPGDVLLIEQQFYFNGNYAPVEVDPLIFDAIAAATAAGIVVVEPTGNGFQDLDHPDFEGMFDRSVRDSGAILVGGGASPLGDGEPRTWQPGGSSYGSRIDAQGWISDVVTTSNGEYDGAYADLFFPATEEYPEGDSRQAYTQSFAGTSAAAPMVAGVVGALQSICLTLHGEPMSPSAVRALVTATGSPQPLEDPFHIGPLPDGRRLLRYGAMP